MIYYTWYDEQHKWSVSNGTQRMIDMDGAKFKTFLLDSINEMKEATDLYFWNMTAYLYDLLAMFRSAGFTPIQDNRKIKEMHEREFKYLIREDFTPFTITIKRHNTSFRIINADNICREPSVGVMKRLLPYMGEKRKPFTISSIARRTWQDYGDNDAMYLRNILCNAMLMNLPTGETLEEYIRPSYHGGFLYDNTPDATPIDDVSVWDINSLYPYVMANLPLPYGMPHISLGAPSQDNLNLYCQGMIYLFVRFRAVFTLKEDGIPCTRLAYADKQTLYFGRDWLRGSYLYDYHTRTMTEDKKPIELTMTITDFFDFLDNYDVEKIQYIDNIWFSASTSLFAEYVEDFYDKKSKEENKNQKQVYKMLLNSMSGNMAKYPEYHNVLFEFSEDDNDPFKYTFTNSVGNNSYIYVGSAITSWARHKILNLIKLNRDRWLYTDTDSLHLKGMEPPVGIKISDALGDIKLEHSYETVSYFKKKMYCGYDRLVDKTHFVFAGMPKTSNEYMTDLLDRKHRGEIIGMIQLTDKQAEAYEKIIHLDPELFKENQEYVEYIHDLEEDAEETKKQKRFGELFAIIDGAPDYKTAVRRLGYAPIPLWQSDSDGEFNQSNSLTFGYIMDEYNFL